MNEPESVETTINEVAARRGTRQTTPGQHGTSSGFPMMAWMRRFRQLDWADRLNVIFATLLGCTLVLALSPLLLATWIWMQLANHRVGVGQPGHLGTDSQTYLATRRQNSQTTLRYPE